MLNNKPRHADYALVPVVRVAPTPRDTWRQLIEVSYVGDWTTLCISANAIPADLGSFDAGAVVVQVLFYQLSGTSTVPSYNNLSLVGGRSLCMGLSDQRDYYYPSSLDVRLPILAPFVEIQLYFPASQVDEVGCNIGAWCTNDPSYQYGNPVPAGYLSDPITAADSILGSNNAGDLIGGTSRGILVPANTFRVVEFLNQTIGKGSFQFRAQEVSGAPITSPEVGTWICTKSATDTTGSTMDQVIYEFTSGVSGYASGIPLVGFRQSVGLLNFTGGAARDVVWHFTAYPEFV